MKNLKKIMQNNIIVKIKDYAKDPLFLSRWASPYRHKEGLAEIIHGNRLSKYVYNGTGRMLIEDVYTSIMPFTHIKPAKSEFSITINPTNKKISDLISKGLSHRDHIVWLEDSVAEFIRMAALSLLNAGVNYYEVIISKDINGEIEKFYLNSIGSPRLIKLLNNYYQIIPWWTAKKNHTMAGIIKIPKSKILRIDFPKELGGKRKLSKILRRLWRLSKEIFPSFHMNNLKTNKDIGFDLNRYAGTKDIEIDQITKNLGWNNRGTLEKRVLEYYSLHRYLILKKTQVILRRTILKRINDILNGQELNLKTKIIISGLPDDDSIVQLQQKLYKGNVEFKEIINATNY